MSARLVAGPGSEPVSRYRRWAWALVLVTGTVLYEAALGAVRTTGNPRLVPTLILLGAAVVPAAVVTFFWGRRLPFTAGGGLLALTALIGGVVGVLVAATLEYGTRRDLGVLPWLAVGMIEELAKLVGPAAALGILRRDRRPADGLLLGVACGAGFAVLETMGYALVALVRSGGELGPVNDLLLDRGLLSPAAHLAWTGVASFALWRAAAEHWRRPAVIRFVGAFLVVAVLHACWDGARERWQDALVAVASLALLAWTAHRLAKRAAVASAPSSSGSSRRSRAVSGAGDGSPVLR